MTSRMRWERNLRRPSPLPPIFRLVAALVVRSAVAPHGPKLLQHAIVDEGQQPEHQRKKDAVAVEAKPHQSQARQNGRHERRDEKGLLRTLSRIAQAKQLA